MGSNERAQARQARKIARQTAKELKILSRYQAESRGLFMAQAFSRIPRLGHVAIFVSQAPSTHDKGQPIPDWLNRRTDKAEALLAAHATKHASGEIIVDPDKRDVFHYLRHKTVSSMVFLAPGTMTHAKINMHEELHWQEMAKERTHLKTGHIEQYMYGQYPISGHIGAPLGAFAIRYPDRLFVAMNLGRSTEAEFMNAERMPTLKSREGLVDDLQAYSQSARIVHDV